MDLSDAISVFKIYNCIFKLKYYYKAGLFEFILSYTLYKIFDKYKKGLGQIYNFSF